MSICVGDSTIPGGLHAKEGKTQEKKPKKNYLRKNRKGKQILIEEVLKRESLSEIR